MQGKSSSGEAFFPKHEYLGSMWFDDFWNAFGFDDFMDESPRHSRARQGTMKPSDWNDLLDMEEDPMGEADGQPEHMVYTRLIPFLAAASSRVSGKKGTGIKLRLDAYLAIARARIAQAGQQTSYCRALVQKVMKLTHTLSPEQLFRMASAMGFHATTYASIDERRDMVDLARRLAGPITSEGEALFSCFLNGQAESGHFNRTQETPSHHTIHVGHVEERDPDLELLGLSKGATAEEIKHAYHNKLKLSHPDSSGKAREQAEKETIALNEAYARLRVRYGF